MVVMMLVMVLVMVYLLLLLLLLLNWQRLQFMTTCEHIH